VKVQLADVRIFIAVANAGGLSAAARQLGIGPMQVSRRIHVLEEELGVRLLHRTTRAVSLTAEGERFLPYARSMIDAEDSARAALLPASATASGVLKLTAPSVFGQAIVMPLLPALLAQHPQLRIDLDLSDRVLDIVGEGFDLALRVATLGDSELVAKRLAGNPRMLCASPQYLARHGVPATLADLATHACITLHAVPRWPVVVDGILQRVSVAPRITTSNVDAARAAALQGLGLAMLTYWDVYRQLRDGDLLSIVLADAAMEDLSVWAVTPTRRFVPARVTIFLDALSRELARLK
jgi:DNA-binding transcriptional LysR family regulator